VIYLVRHAHAGDRRSGPDDRLRPLSDQGRREAASIASCLDLQDGALVLSSPRTRCVQTVEPLAERFGRTVEICAALDEDEPAPGVVQLVAEVPDGSVLCTHGTPLRPVIEAFVAAGARLDGSASWDKGVVWGLERIDGRVVAARVALRAASPSC
jgi:8-oxo-dGTP diphosphatase